MVEIFYLREKKINQIFYEDKRAKEKTEDNSTSLDGSQMILACFSYIVRNLKN